MADELEYFDEQAQFTEEQYQVVLGRLKTVEKLQADLAACRAEKERLREALERIAGVRNKYQWSESASQLIQIERIARAALTNRRQT